jgi:hypothetical protein
MNPSLRFLFVLVSLQLWAAVAMSQEQFLKHFTVDQGLPSNEVYRIDQDDAGYLWVMTDRGIVRYDGYGFDEMIVSGAPAVYPWFGASHDASGKMYFFGLKGHLAVYEKGRLYAHPFNNKISALHGNRPIIFFASRNDSLWLSYTDLGKYLITPGGQIIPQPVAPGVHFDLGKKHFFHYFGKNDGGERMQTVYITWQNGVDRDSVQVPVRRPLKCTEWVQMGGYDLFVIGHYMLFYQDRKLLRKLELPRVAFAIAAVDSTHVLLGFENGGAALYRLGDATLKGPIQTWLPGLSVTSIHQDFQGGLWFTTIESGVFYAYPTRAASWSGPGKIVFLEKNKDNIFACYHSGLVRIFHEGRILRELRVPLQQEEYILSYAFPLKGTIAAFTNKGVHIYEDRWIFSDDYPRGLPPRDERTARYIEQHRDHLLSRVFAREDIIAKKITSLQADASGGCWMGTFDGLYLYRNDSLISFGEKNAILSDRIVGLRELKDGWLAAATLGNGLVVFRGDRMFLLDKDNGQITPIINDMETSGDTIWLGTNKGISKVLFTGAGFQVWHYGATFGLPTLAIHELVVTGGWLYFKWIDRIVAIETARLQNLVPVGPPFITAVTVKGRRTDMTQKGDFRYDQNEVKINYNSINFAHGARQMYRYRLHGSEGKWHFSTERQAVFTTLPAGNYSFEVQVADVQGHFLPGTARYDFVIHPAFWQQWWFPFLTGLLLLFIAFLFFRLRLRAIKNKNRLMLDLAENQQKALVQLINPHFIFNVLNSFSSAVATEDKMNALTIIGRFTKLIRLSIELNRKKKVLLRQEILLLERYIELEMMRFPDKFSYEMEIDPAVHPGRIEIPGMLVQPFVENAIKHGVMHLFKRKGHIRIAFSIRDELLFCTVEDNGIGREKAAEINRNKRRGHQPAGIDITLHRLRLLHEEKKKKYYYEVKDLVDEQGAPAGTRVVFSIPFNLENEGHDKDTDRR